MIRKTSAAGIALLFIAARHHFAQSQPPAQTTLVIDIQDLVTYLTDISAGSFFD